MKPSRYILAIFLIGASLEGMASEEAKLETQITRLIVQLGHTDFKKRAAAEKTLAEVLSTEASVSFLEKSVAPLDLEIRMRASNAIRSYLIRRFGMIACCQDGLVQLYTHKGEEVEKLDIGSNQGAAWSPDLTHLAVAGSGNAVSFWRGATTYRTVILGPMRPRDLSWAPDGRKLACWTWSTQESGCRKIRVLDPVKGTVTRISGEEGTEWGPQWSPVDSNKLLFFSSDGIDKLRRTLLCQMDGEGKSRKVLARFYPSDITVSAAWSPRGDFIAVAAKRREGGSNAIILLDREGRKSVLAQKPGVDFLNPKWSPDGSRLAFRSMNLFDSNIWIVGVDGKGLKKLTDSSLENTQPSWSPDGREILFLSGREDKGDRTERGFIPKMIPYIMKSDGTNQRRFVFNRMRRSHGSWILWLPGRSPSGQE